MLTYRSGNDYKVIVPQFQQLFNIQLDATTATTATTANYDLSILNAFRATRFQQSISKNPYFFNGPFSGVVVQLAAYTFIYRFISNKSVSYPEGILNQDVLKTFYSITGSSGPFVWTEGHENSPKTGISTPLAMSIPFLSSSPTSLPRRRNIPNSLILEGTRGRLILLLVLI
jgi:hypothetical protein